jgi:hypothetical protein
MVKVMFLQDLFYVGYLIPATATLDFTFSSKKKYVPLRHFIIKQSVDIGRKKEKLSERIV